MLRLGLENQWRTSDCHGKIQPMIPVENFSISWKWSSYESCYQIDNLTCRSVTRGLQKSSFFTAQHFWGAFKHLWMQTSSLSLWAFAYMCRIRFAAGGPWFQRRISRCLWIDRKEFFVDDLVKCVANLRNSQDSYEKRVLVALKSGSALKNWARNKKEALGKVPV